MFDLICILFFILVNFIFIFKNIRIKEILKGEQITIIESIGFVSLIFLFSLFKVVLFMIIEKF